MNKQDKKHALLSMKIVYDLISKFYTCRFNENKTMIIIPFTGYTITVKITKELPYETYSEEE